MIFFFTGTGNSLMVAKSIASQSGDRLLDITSVIQTESYDVNIEENEAVGFVMPTYYYGIPIHIPEFLSRLHFSHTPNYVWTCLTCEGMTAGAGNMLSQALRACGLPTHARFVCPVANNTYVMAPQQEPKNLEQLLDKAQKRAENIGKFVAERRCGNYDDCAAFGADYITAQYYGSYVSGRNTKRFKLVLGRCIGCGLCASNCPDSAIEIVRGKATWTKPRCIYCLRCINCCPQNAIAFGNQDNSHTYINPRV